MPLLRVRRHACYQAPYSRLLRPAAVSGMLRSFPRAAGHCVAGPSMRGVGWRSGRKHVRHVRDGPGVLACTWIHRRAAIAGPAWLCKEVGEQGSSVGNS